MRNKRFRLKRKSSKLLGKKLIFHLYTIHLLRLQVFKWFNTNHIDRNQYRQYGNSVCYSSDLVLPAAAERVAITVSLHSNKIRGLRLQAFLRIPHLFILITNFGRNRYYAYIVIIILQKVQIPNEM